MVRHQDDEWLPIHDETDVRDEARSENCGELRHVRD
jgi:hypothetical protein